MRRGLVEHDRGAAMYHNGYVLTQKGRDALNAHPVTPQKGRAR